MFDKLETIIENAETIKQEKETELQALNEQLKQVWQDYIGARLVDNEAEADRLHDLYDDIETKAWQVEMVVDEYTAAIIEAKTGLSALKYLNMRGA
jgi:hypothetical protein